MVNVVPDHHISLLLAVRPLAWTSRLYGFLPFTIDKRHCNQLRISKFGVVHGSCLVTVLSLYRFIDNYFVRKENSLADSIDRGSAIIDAFLVTTSYFSYVCHVKSLEIVYKRMLIYNKLIHLTAFYRKFFFINILEIIFGHFILQSYYLCYYLSDPEDFIENILEIVIESYLMYGMFLLNLQFANSLMFLCQIFKIVNNELSVLLDWGKIFVVRNYLELKERKTQKKKLALLAFDDSNVAPLIEMYDNVCDSCGLLEKSFGWSNAVSAAFTLIQTLQALYSVTVVSDDSPMMFVFWFAHLFLQEWLVLFTCECIAEQTKRTGALVHNLIIQTKDQHLKDQLQQFSLHLLHRKVKFTACGLFPLNYTLIYSIAGAVTTYLVILIQFQNAARTPRGYCNVSDVNQA